jgi:hypothetical protein
MEDWPTVFRVKREEVNLYRTLPRERIPHVMGFAVLLFLVVQFTDVPAWSLIPVWYLFFYAMCDLEERKG